MTCHNFICLGKSLEKIMEHPTSKSGWKHTDIWAILCTKCSWTAERIIGCLLYSCYQLKLPTWCNHLLSYNILFRE